MLQPLSISSAASQSRSSGCVGGLPFRPKSKTVGTSGVPRCRAQRWFTATRAVSGLRRSVIHSASALRRPLLRHGKATSGSSFAEFKKRVGVHCAPASLVYCSLGSAAPT